MSKIDILTPACPSTRPPLRDELLLNGVWDEGQQVPQYDGILDFDEATFQRQVDVPASWAGKIIKLEFVAVNFIADVYIGEEHVMNHVGGWMPFTADVTKLVTPGQNFRLKVHVKGPHHQPIVDADGHVQWPVGGWFTKRVGGIADDVWLRAYGEVHIEDTFIQTSYRNKTLTLDTTLTNTTAKARTVRLEAQAVLASNDSDKVSFTGPTVTLAAGETRVVQAVFDWENPKLWWPDDPRLYHLKSRLLEGEAVPDEETRRFGFREIWISGNQFRLNGIRINLFGDYQTVGDRHYTTPEIYWPERWPETVDKIKAMNIRILRWHHNPVPQYILDVTDEKGLLICDESSNYARNYHMESDRKAYIANAKRCIGPWIKADRNHPSVYMWNATNEMTYPNLGAFAPEDLQELGDLIRSYDPTRPVGYDGDTSVRPERGNRSIEDELVDYHYPEGYNKEPVGSIYSWAHLVHDDKPTGSGECLHTKSPLPEVQESVARNTWWLGIWLRGMRYTSWTNVKPACWWFTESDLESSDPLQRQRTINLRNAYAPVALFDKDYDDLGITPYVTGLTPGGTLPTVTAGDTLKRTLILYNDEFRDTSVNIEVLIRSGDKVHARGSQTLDVPLGEHIDIPYTFEVPFVAGAELDVVLRTSKRGEQTFEEVRKFKVEGESSAQESSDTVSFGKEVA